MSNKKTGLGPEVGNPPEEGKTGLGPEIGNTPAPPSDPPTPPASNEAMIHPTPINPAMFAGRLTEYTPPKGEEGDYHVEMEQVEFDPATGEKKSKPFLQKFDPVTWSRLKDQYPKQGFTFIKVWHDPTAKPE